MARKRRIPLNERDKKSISVTYSKRRKTLFAKAAETSLQFQIPIALLVSSTSQRNRYKFFGFGNPSIDDVLNSYLGGIESSSSSNAGGGGMMMMKIDDGAKNLLEEVNELEIKVKEMKDKEKKGGEIDDEWWFRDIESMDLEELCEFGEKLEKMKEEVRVRLNSENFEIGEFSGKVDNDDDGGDGKNENVEEEAMELVLEGTNCINCS